MAWKWMSAFGLGAIVVMAAWQAHGQSGEPLSVGNSAGVVIFTTGPCSRLGGGWHALQDSSRHSVAARYVMIADPSGAGVRAGALGGDERISHHHLPRLTVGEIRSGPDPMGDNPGGTTHGLYRPTTGGSEAAFEPVVQGTGDNLPFRPIYVALNACTRG